MYVYQKIFETSVYIQYTCKIKSIYVYRKIFFKIYFFVYIRAPHVYLVSEEVVSLPVVAENRTQVFHNNKKNP